MTTWHPRNFERRHASPNREPSAALGSIRPAPIRTALVVALASVTAVACDRAPTAPAASSAQAVVASGALARAEVEWTIIERTFPSTGVNFGLIECLGQTARAYGGVTIRFHDVTRPDGSVIEKYWTIELWESYHLVIGGETWWPVKHLARSGVRRYDETGALIAEHGHGSVFTLRNETTGTLLDWPGKWHFQTTPDGDVVVEFEGNACRLRG